MKSLIRVGGTALTIILFLACFAFQYFEAQRTTSNALESLPSSLGHEFVITGVSRNQDSHALIKNLQDAATQSDYALIRGTSFPGPNDIPVHILYAQPSMATHLVEGLTAIQGVRVGAQASSRIAVGECVASVSAPGCSVDLQVFGSSTPVQIRPIMDMADETLPFGTYYIVDLGHGDQKKFESLLSRDGIGYGGAGPVTGGVASSPLGRMLTLGGAVAALLVALMTAYEVVGATKTVAVMDLIGLPRWAIWTKQPGSRILLTVGLSVALSVLIATLIPARSDSFVRGVTTSSIALAALFLLATGAALALARQGPLTTRLKNRTYTGAVFSGVAIFKLLTTVTSGALACMLVTNFATVQKSLTDASKWSAVDAYGIFYPVAADPDTSQRGGVSQSDLRLAGEVYSALNKLGAVYVDSTAFEEGVTNPGVVPIMDVNPNYLQSFKINSMGGNPVQVAENESSMLLLVPSSRKSEMRDIISRVQEDQEQVIHAQSSLDGNKHTLPPIRTIEIADQDVFAFDPSLKASANNTIQSPVMRVLTLSNSVPLNRLNGINGGVNGALKVRLTGGPQATYQQLLPELQKLGVATRLPYLVRTSDSVAAEIARLQSSLFGTALLLATSLFIQLVAVTQFTSLGFRHYARRIVVRRILGAGLVQRQKEVLTLNGLLIILQTMMIAGMATLVLSTPIPTIGTVTFLLGVFEILVIGLLMVRIERTSTVRVLKEEF